MAKRKIAAAEIKETAVVETAPVVEAAAEPEKIEEVKPDVKAEEPAVKVEEPAVKAEKPAARRGRKPAAAKAETPEVKAEKPAARRGRKPAAAKAETPEVKAEKPAARRGRKPAAAKVEKPEAKAEKPAARRGRKPAAAKTESAAKAEKPVTRRGRKPAAEKAAVPEQTTKRNTRKKGISYDDVFEAAKKKVLAADITKIKYPIAVNVELSGSATGDFYIFIDADNQSISVEPYKYNDYDVNFRVDADEFLAVMTGKKNFYTALSEGNVKVTGITTKAILFIDAAF